MTIRREESESDLEAAEASQQKAKPLQVDDPIIIKGGSISLSFDQHNFVENTSSSSEKNRVFAHDFQPPLRRLKIFRGGAIFYQTALNPTDAIMICYAGSGCPETLPSEM